jgi:hypothetical protein
MSTGKEKATEQVVGGNFVEYGGCFGHDARFNCSYPLLLLLLLLETTCEYMRDWFLRLIVSPM